MPNLIDKTDIFSIIPNFTLNIESREVDVHCYDAQIFDFKPLLPTTFYNSLVGVRGTELDAIFISHIKPLLSYIAASRFLLWQGKNITRFGVQKIQEQTSQAVTDKGVGELMNDLNNKAAVSWTNLYAKLLADGYIYDSITYNFSEFLQSNDPAKRSFAIKAI